MGLQPGVPGQSLQCHLGGERCGSRRAGQGAPRPRSALHWQENPAWSTHTEPTGEAGFTPSHHCQRGTSHPRASEPPAARARHAASKPLGLSIQRFAASAASSRGRAGGATRPQTRLSRAWLCKPQWEPFQLVGLLPCSQVPSSSSQNGCQSPTGSRPGSRGCLCPHAEHAVPAASKGLSLPGLPQEVGAGPGGSPSPGTARCYPPAPL